METWKNEVREVFNSVKIDSVNEFSFAGQLIQIQVALPSAREANPMLKLSASLQSEIYGSCYCRRFRGRYMPIGNADLRAENIIERLSTANLGKGHWEAGWTIARVETSGRIWARRRGCMQWFWPGYYLVDGSESPHQLAQQ